MKRHSCLILLSYLFLFISNAHSLSLEEKKDYFEYQRFQKINSIKLVEKAEGYKLFKIKLKGQNPITKENDFKTEFLFYQPTKLQKAPYVIMLPPLRGIKSFDKDLAKYMANHGLNILLMGHHEDFKNLNQPLKTVPQAIKRMVTRIRTLIDYAETQPFINIDQSGIMGTSLGGIMSALTYTIEDRVKYGYFIVAGGNIPEILGKSQVRMFKKYRDTRILKEHLNGTKGYINALKDLIPADALDFAPFKEPRNIHLVMATQDTSVPVYNQIKLWRALGSPKHDWVSGDHIKAILQSLSNKNGIFQFFNDKFNSLRGNL